MYETIIDPVVEATDRYLDSIEERPEHIDCMCPVCNDEYYEEEDTWLPQLMNAEKELEL